MRKILCCMLSVLLLLSPLAFTACAERTTGRTSYAIEAEYAPSTRQLSARMRVKCVNVWDNALTELKFQLWANAYREGAEYSPVSSLYAPYVYYRGKSYGGIEIQEVTGGNFTVGGEDENILTVPLTDPLYPDESVELFIAFTVTLPQANHRLGEGAHNVTLANFYPVLCHYGEQGFEEYVYSDKGDPFVGDCADYTVSLTVPKEYTAVFTGEGERAETDETAIYTVHAENVREVAFVLGTFFRTERTDVGGITVEYYYFADSDPARSLSCAAQSLAFYSTAFGAYAYPRYTVVQTDFPYGGMEYPMLSMVSQLLSEEERALVIAHETAHQWWYAAVGSNQFTHAWMDEGLAEYSTALFFNANGSFGIESGQVVADAERAYRNFFSIHSQLNGEADTCMDRALTDFTSEYEYVNITYRKGAILFDKVRAVVGDRKFSSSLKHYYKKYCYSVAQPQDMIACFSAIGCNIEGLFASFTEGRCVI